MRVAELEKENDELRERIDRMEAELNTLRTSGFIRISESTAAEHYGTATGITGAEWWCKLRDLCCWKRLRLLE